MSTRSITNNTFSIREASQLTGLPASTLRYYESIGIVNPVERGVTSKHRVYTQADIDILDTIACLSATGMKISDMQAYIANVSSGEVDAAEQIELLEAQKVRLDDEQRQILQRQEYVSLKIDYWRAYEQGDEMRLKEITARAKRLAQELKKL